MASSIVVSRGSRRLEPSRERASTAESGRAPPRTSPPSSASRAPPSRRSPASSTCQSPRPASGPECTPGNPSPSRRRYLRSPRVLRAGTRSRAGGSGTPIPSSRRARSGPSPSPRRRPHRSTSRLSSPTLRPASRSSSAPPSSGASPTRWSPASTRSPRTLLSACGCGACARRSRARRRTCSEGWVRAPSGRRQPVAQTRRSGGRACRLRVSL